MLDCSKVPNAVHLLFAGCAILKVTLTDTYMHKYYTNHNLKVYIMHYLVKAAA